MNGTFGWRLLRLLQLWSNDRKMNHNLKAWTCLTFISLFKSAQATIEAVDGCDHSSECVATYWRTIWILILILSLLYLISVAWTCWISSKFSFLRFTFSKAYFLFMKFTSWQNSHFLVNVAFVCRSCSEKILLFVRRPGFQVWLGFGQSSSRVSEAPNAQGILGKVASTICRNCLSWL